MARAMLIIFWSFFAILISANYLTEATIGVNWGTQASHPLLPGIVVKMLNDNGIKKVKLFDADAYTVDSLAGTSIEVMLGIPNNQLQDLASSLDNAVDWVKKNVTKHVRNDNGGVDIRLML